MMCNNKELHQWCTSSLIKKSTDTTTDTGVEIISDDYQLANELRKAF